MNEKVILENENEEVKKQEEIIEVNEEEDNKPKNKKKYITIGCIIIGVLIVIVAIFAVFSIMNNKNGNIIYGVKVDEIDVSQMSVEEARKKLNEYINEKLNSNIIFYYEEYEINVTPLQEGITFDVEKSIDEAYKIGRTGNIFSNSFTMISTRINGKEIEIDMNVNDEEFSELVEEINVNLSNGIQQPSYYIENNNLIITAGKEGIAVDEEEFKKIIYDKIKTEINNEDKIQIPIVVSQPNEIDMEKIYEDVHKEAQDAYVTQDPFEIHPDVEGVDFEISIDQAKAMLQEEKDEYTIPLKITKPSVTINSLGDEAFPNMLATYSTTYSTADVNRSTNIRISANKINGIVLLPGEEFSYNKTLGPRTPEAGYKLGAAYIGGKVVSDYGGGVCQTSSTLYNTVLLSNLEVTSRTSHYFAAAYVPIGRDATVYWPSLDFKFKNNRNYPIKIKAYANNGTIKVEIFGTSEESDYEVELQSYVTSYIPYKTEYKDDNTLAEGVEVIEQAGANGCISEAYKILKKDGQIISKTFLSRDTYSAKNKIVRRGTKKTEQSSKNEKTNNNINQNNEQQSVTAEQNSSQQSSTQEQNVQSNDAQGGGTRENIRQGNNQESKTLSE